MQVNKENLLAMAQQGGRARLPRASSADLFRGGCRFIIEHAGEEYCLRLTRNERLILTKN
jgi:hemin uptake protein HemP